MRLKEPEFVKKLEMFEKDLAELCKVYGVISVAGILSIKLTEGDINTLKEARPEIADKLSDQDMIASVQRFEYEENPGNLDHMKAESVRATFTELIQTAKAQVEATKATTQ
jgi:hypothetical protein